MNKINIFWFRRDLRLDDNTGLFHSLNQGIEVLPIFIFDKKILSRLTGNSDQRVEFIYKTVKELKEKIEHYKSSLYLFYDHPENVFKFLIQNYSINCVYANTDYESYAKERDQKVKSLLEEYGIGFISSKDQVIFEKDDLLKKDGKPYTIYTPYMKRWRELINSRKPGSFPSEKYLHGLVKVSSFKITDSKELGFHFKDYEFPHKEIDEKK